MKYSGKWWTRLLIAGVILVGVSGCIRQDTGEILDHSAVTLVVSNGVVGIHDPPAWSPNGNLLAATRIDQPCFGRCGFGIYILNLQTHELYPPFDTDWEGNPAWTTDPEIISFNQSGATSAEIHTFNLRSSERQFIMNGGRASWSPNGKYMAAERLIKRPDGYGRTLSVLDLTTGQETQVFETPQATDESITGLSWSPDSNWLALSAQWWTPDEAYTDRIFTVKADGTELRQVTDGSESPGWMPDGEWLFFVTKDDGLLVFAPLDFSCVITPLDITGIDSASISPSGEQIAFAHDANIYLLDLNELLGVNREALVCP